MAETKIRYDRCTSGDTAVYLDNRRAGTIAPFEHGWTYIPAGHTVRDRGEPAAAEAYQRGYDEEVACV